MDPEKLAERQAIESAEILAMSVVIADRGSDEDVRWAYAKSEEMTAYGDDGPGWWIKQVKERFPWA